MKRSLVASYLYGITDKAGERYSAILRYFVPELITAFFLYSLLSLIDIYFIGHLRSTSTYATQGVGNSLLHFIVKVAEGIAIGPLVLCGFYNGAQEFKRVGKALVESLWLSAIVGAVIALALYAGAPYILMLLGVDARMVHLGVPFLKIRAIGVFFTFLSFGLFSFFRGIKDTRTPMTLFIIGGAFFVFFDYALIFGAFGLPTLGLVGSALAAAIQYGVMVVAGFTYLLWRADLRSKN